MIRATGIECFHFDSAVPTAMARELAGDRLSLMGGTSNYQIVRKGTPETIGQDVAEKLAHHIDIIGPECAVPLDAPYRNLALLAEEAKRQGTFPLPTAD
jgi:[methyl-Co(III) methanol-specific corrinoid protein]:coenzyme M methyltransferase